jgi:hypothetical protein
MQPSADPAERFRERSTFAGKTIAALFDDFENAVNAVRRLETSGLQPFEISVIPRIGTAIRQTKAPPWEHSSARRSVAAAVHWCLAQWPARGLVQWPYRLAGRNPSQRGARRPCWGTHEGGPSR